MSFNCSTQKIDKLLILRGLCSLGVLAAHVLNDSTYSLGYYLSRLPQTADMSWFTLFIISIFPYKGSPFVYCFFVLSGYLMGKLFFNGNYSFTAGGIIKFYKSRFKRIAPLYYFNILFILFYEYHHFTGKSIDSNILFITALPPREWINPIAWTISVEMQYYLLSPFVYYIFRKPALKYYLMLVSSGIALYLIYYFNIDFRELNMFQYMFMFIAGFSLNIIIRRFKFKKYLYSDVIAITAGFFFGNIFYYYFNYMGMKNLAVSILVVFISGTIVVLELPDDKEDKAKQTPSHRLKFVLLNLFNWLGILSYGIYLWHFQIINATRNNMQLIIKNIINSGIVSPESLAEKITYSSIQTTVVILLTVVVSMLTFLFIELQFKPNLYDFRKTRFTQNMMKRRDTIIIPAVLALSLLMAALTFLTYTYPEAYYQFLLKAAPNSSRLHYQLGSHYFKVGMDGAALKELLRAVEISPDVGDAHHKIAQIYSKRGSTVEAVRELTVEIEINPTNQDAKLMLADIYIRDRKDDEALKILTNMDQSIGGVRLLFAIMYFHQRLYDKSLTELNSLVKRFPDDFNLYYYLGIVYAAKSENEKAKRELTRCLEINPQFMAAKELLDSIK